MRRISERYKEFSYDIVAVGGGMSGLCAALAAARHGAKVALVNARPVLGGNASSEIRIHISGADQGFKQPDYAEGGILYELMLENKARNPNFCYSTWDAVLFEAAHKEENLTLYQNTVMYDCEMDGSRIAAVLCVQETTEMRYRLTAPVFIDATGNGTLGYYAGAAFRTGSEEKAVYNEPHAPETPNNYRMGNTIMMKAVNMGHPVPFTPPAFAKKLTEKQLAKRIHCVEMRDHIDVSDSPNPEEYKRTSMTSSAAIDYGYWWLELMGEDDQDIIEQFEALRDDLMAYAYGLWDHIKNNSEGVHQHHAENFALEWVGALPGMRESRRFEGDYILTENDILQHRVFDDAICYGGWCVDLHAAHGLLDFDKLPSDCNFYEGAYTIPYRCYYSRNIDNLMLAGRDISTSRLALASTRIIGCCAIGGEAVGIAAAECARRGCDPRALAPHIRDVQQAILRDGGYLPGYKNEDAGDLARMAKVAATSFIPGGEAQNVINGLNRRMDGQSNAWISDGMAADGETLSLCWDAPQTINELRLTLHSDFKYPIRITMSPNRQKQQRDGVPKELLRDYDAALYCGEKLVRTVYVRDNHQRHNVLRFAQTPCDRVEIRCLSTHGAGEATVFEVRAYA